MNYTDWLRRQVARLENEIQSNPIFATDTPATADELRELRKTIVLHTYLRQQLLRRDRVAPVGEQFVEAPAIPSLHPR